MDEIRRNEKGQFIDSGNPGGRPKGQSITKQLRRYMWEIDAETGTSRMEHMCIILWQKAMAGDLRAIGLIMDRLEGRPKQRIETDESLMQPIRVFDTDPVSLILKDKDGNEMIVDKDEMVVEVDSFLKEDYKKTS
ncbi:MAG TPA: hypothetical protein EYM47_03285 [Candidatus Marinimicrobia bacterium]|jgi:hypothetical protein|nr:hypothetical protein [Candidatus Neomarinimicrobiota bacterium]